MKSMVVLIDTNVALDLLTERQPFYHNARAVFLACAGGEIEGYIAFHSLPNIFYILRKVYSDEKRRAMLKRLCLVLRVTGQAMTGFVRLFHEKNFQILRIAFRMNARRKYSPTIL